MTAGPSIDFKKALISLDAQRRQLQAPVGPQPRHVHFERKLGVLFFFRFVAHRNFVTLRSEGWPDNTLCIITPALETSRWVRCKIDKVSLRSIIGTPSGSLTQFPDHVDYRIKSVYT